VRPACRHAVDFFCARNGPRVSSSGELGSRGAMAWAEFDTANNVAVSYGEQQQ
jgi:hypothetical protein